MVSALPEVSSSLHVLEGLRFGFRLNFTGGALLSAKRNMQSAYDHPEVVSKYLEAERDRGSIAGPFAIPPPDLHISRFGVVPKSTPDTWRLILDLSNPLGANVNSFIPKSECSVRYLCIQEAIDSLMAFGKGALMAKFDLAHAYRLVPVHPDDRWLLGMKWKDQFFIDLCLPFGLGSAHKIFTKVANELCHIIIILLLVFIVRPIYIQYLAFEDSASRN